MNGNCPGTWPAQNPGVQLEAVIRHDGGPCYGRERDGEREKIPGAFKRRMELDGIRHGFPGDSVVKNPPANARDLGSIPGLESFPWRRKWQPTPVFLPGKPRGQRSRPQGYKRIGHNGVTKQQQQEKPQREGGVAGLHTSGLCTSADVVPSLNSTVRNET